MNMQPPTSHSGDTPLSASLRVQGVPQSALATKAVHAGPNARDQSGLINPPIHRASTIIYNTVEDYMDRHSGLYKDVIYGLYGTKTTFALADAIAQLEGGFASVITSSGTSAIALTMTAFVSNGDHLLVADCIYGPTRKFLTDTLSRFGIEIEYFDPKVGAGIGELCKANTKLIYLEVPGSQTFDMIDVGAVTAVARSKGILTAMDNTWATPVYFRPLEYGVDVSIASATKYLSGHSDVVLGAMTTANENIYRQLKDTASRWGNCASPDDCYLVHRGIRTLETRLERHQQTAAILVDWFGHQPEVVSVLYPALKSDPGYDIWKRDFKGATGLFGVELHDLSQAETSAFFNNFSLFQMGSSWGGFESLAVPAWPAPIRAHASLDASSSALIRIHAGLEAPEDLINDLESAFGRIRAMRTKR